jgi:uncharacterized protein YodC (DUF2158 family)
VTLEQIKLQIGDVVVLKSGGPPMTVSDIGDYQPFGPTLGALCIWFNNGKKEEHVFEIACLERHLNA